MSECVSKVQRECKASLCRMARTTTYTRLIASPCHTVVTHSSGTDPFTKVVSQTGTKRLALRKRNQYKHASHLVGSRFRPIHGNEIRKTRDESAAASNSNGPWSQTR